MGDEVAAHGAGDEATDEPAAGDEEEGDEEVADGEEVFAVVPKDVVEEVG